MSSPRDALRPLFSRTQEPRGISLAGRIILINAVAMLLMVSGLFYFGRSLDRLADDEFRQLARQAEVIGPRLPLVYAQATPSVLPATEGPPLRVQIYDTEGRLQKDLEQISFKARLDDAVVVPSDMVNRTIYWLAEALPYGRLLPLYDEQAKEVDPALAADIKSAVQGTSAQRLWKTEDNRLVLTLAVPLVKNGKGAGALLLIRNQSDIAHIMRIMRVELLQNFAILLGVCAMLSLYMAQTIARPLRRLARAARSAQAIAGGPPDIPDFSKRGDEIGELSTALKAMTAALWERLGAIESFAADVSHELKNPLSSMKSALETLERVDDPARRATLINILAQDVARMDRLISDIASASRLEAELGRTPPEVFDLVALISMLVASRRQAGTNLELHVGQAGLLVRGLQGRIVQVVENLIGNALSFNPPGKPVRISLHGGKRHVRLLVEDEGPGLPTGQEQKIFERFYSERPQGEDFGSHSGLGLSICRQITEGHGGRIYAENRFDEAGKILGARFVVELPRQSEA